MKFIFVLIPIILSINLQAQNYFDYNRLINNAKLVDTNNLLTENERLHVKLSIMDSAFNTVGNNGFKEDFISAAKYAIKLNKFDNVEDYCKMAFSKGLRKRQLKRDIIQLNSNFKQTSNYKSLMKVYRKERRAYKKQIQFKLRWKLVMLLMRDQRYRILRYKPEKQNRLDSINALKLLKIYNKNGHLPSIQEVGENYIILLQPIMLHQKTDNALMFSNILLQMYKNGEYNDMESIFNILDQRCYRAGAIFDIKDSAFYLLGNSHFVNKHHIFKQCFGTIQSTENIDNKFYKFTIPVYNLDEANKVRKQFGVLSISEECKLKKIIIYDEKQFIEKYGEFNILIQ